MVNVSIIVPAYNCEKTIGRCIDSILHQEYEDFELILVDDGSSDYTPSIIDGYAKKDKRIVAIHQENAGVSAARNAALDVSQGKYVQFLDADDWIPSSSTKMLVRAMEKNDVDLVVGNFYRVVKKNVSEKGSLGKEYMNTILSQKEFSLQMMNSPSDFYYGVLWNKLYKNEIIQNNHIRMDEEISFSEDFLFNLDYYAYMKDVYSLGVPIYYYVRTEGSLVSSAKTIADLMNMKMTVFEHYNAYYKKVLSNEDYKKNRLMIASYLLDAASDDGAISFLPATHKLGKETVPVNYYSEDINPLTLSYYIQKYVERYDNETAHSHDLTLEEVQVMRAIRYGSPYNNAAGIADYLHRSETSVNSSLNHLNRLGYIHIYHVNKVSYILEADKARQLDEDLDHGHNDLMNVFYKGIDPDQIEVANQLINRIGHNLMNVLHMKEVEERLRYGNADGKDRTTSQS